RRGRGLPANVLTELPVVGDKLSVHGLVRPSSGCFDERDDLGEALVPAVCDRPPCTRSSERCLLRGGRLCAGGALPRGGLRSHAERTHSGGRRDLASESGWSVLVSRFVGQDRVSLPRARRKE